MATAAENLLTVITQLRAAIAKVLADNADLQAQLANAVSANVIDAAAQAVSDAANSLSTRSDLLAIPSALTDAAQASAAAASTTTVSTPVA